MPLDSGRKKDPAWEEVKDIENQKYKCACNHCDLVISKKIERVREHLKKCRVMNAANLESKDLEDVANSLLSPQSSSRPSSSMSVSISDSDNFLIDAPRISTSAQKKSRSGSLNAFVTRTTADQKEDIDTQLAKFIFSENIPFMAVEGEQFQTFCEVMRPGYKPPNRKILGGRLLDKVNEEVVSLTKEKITSKDSLTLTQDGWSSVQNDPVIAHSFYDGKNNHLLNLKDCGSNKKTAEFCFDMLDEAIKEIRMKYNKDVFAICTDNEAKMKKLRSLVERKYPMMVVYGCSAHYANLLEQDVVNTRVMKHIVEIQKYFRNVHRAHGLLKERSGCMPQIPNDTCWNSSVDCLQTFIKNHGHYVSVKTEMLIIGEDMPKHISQSVDNIGLLRDAETLLSQMNKFGSALDKFQSDNCSIGEAVKIWNDMLEDRALLQFRGAIEKRYKDALTSAHIIAYMTNPKFASEAESKLEERDIEAAEAWLQSIDGDFEIEFEKFKIRMVDLYVEKMFSDRYVEEFEAADWWRIVNRKADRQHFSGTEKFSKFMIGLHSCPASSLE